MLCERKIIIVISITAFNDVCDYGTLFNLFFIRHSFIHSFHPLNIYHLLRAYVRKHYYLTEEEEDEA